MRKTWLLRKNTVNPWPLLEQMPADLKFERETMPVASYTLCANDWLYVPNGYWHATHAVEESLSLSVGLASRSALDLLDLARQKVLHDLRWRQRLPSASSAAGVPDGPAEDRLRLLLADLGTNLQKLFASPRFLADCLAKLSAVAANPQVEAERSTGD